MTTIHLGFSSCPNDTFMFHAMLHGLVDTGSYRFVSHIDDVEALNIKAFDQALQVTKLSFCAYLQLRDKYVLLDAGAALGYGCGPLLVAKSSEICLDEARIAVPGEHTTAYLLLKLWAPTIKNVEVTRFDTILPGIADGIFDGGVIIHEGRFVFPDYNCVKIVDLGEWWEVKTGLPIPLGCIAVSRDAETIAHKEAIEDILRQSIQYAFDHREASRQFMREHAQELDDKVIDEHVALYVNEFSLTLGKTGRKAVKTLAEMARCQTIAPSLS